MQQVQALSEPQTFSFQITPTAKGRPRFAGGHAFTPAKTRMAEEGLREALISDGAECYPRTTPLKVTVVFGVEVPKRPERLPIRRPDLDQYVKLVLDAGNEVLWIDDAQIVAVSAMKTYSDVPFIKIRVEEA